MSKKLSFQVDPAAFQSDFLVREKLEEFSSYFSSLVSYADRSDLTIEEKVEIGNYQDVWPYNFQKQDWSVPISSDWAQKSWCYIINSCCRSSNFYNSLTDAEKEIVCNSIRLIENAIQKSNIQGRRFVYRGVYDLHWLPSKNIGDEFVEAAFGSFSLNMEHALKYTNLENPIIFQLELDSQMKALYIDHAEYEVLRPRKSVYVVKDILKEFNYSNQNKETTIYYIKEILK